MTFKVTILTLFPEVFPGTLGISIPGTSLKNKVWEYEILDLRQFGLTKHKNVDDEPYGGGAGMVMRPDVLGHALDKAIESSGTDIIYYLSPRGKVFNQKLAKEIIEEKNIIMLCGRFEGIDERVIHEYNVREISIGDFVLSGGEVATLAILEACIRLIPGVLGNSETLDEESFSIGNNNLLEYPLYTRPENWRGHKVPEVLTSGNHAKIKEWRMNQSIEITKKRRPELL